MPHTYEYPRPSVTVDAVMFGFDGAELQILLIERAHEPFSGSWAIPGGFVDMNESLEAAALRELQEETGITRVFLEQLYTFGDVGRDPRGWVVSVAYYALVKPSEHPAAAASDARQVRWFAVSALPPLAFDHKEIVATALARLRAKVRYEQIGFELLPPKFTLSELQALYEAILGTRLDKRNFRRKILGMKLLVALTERRQGGQHRPAQLFRFDQKAYKRLRKNGFHFEL